MTPTETQRCDRRGDHRRPVDLLINRFLNGYPYMCRATDINMPHAARVTSEPSRIT